jgi:hypothetical protein
MMITAVLLSRVTHVVAAPTPGSQMPSFTLISAAGDTRPLWSKGRITVVTFCAFWCDTWKEQSRRMTEARAALRGLPVAWTMVSVDGRWADKAREAAWGDIAHTALLDSGGYWTNRLGIRSVPTTLVLDSSGRVHYAAQGIERSQTLLAVVRGLMQRVTNPGVTNPGVPVQLVFDDFPSRDPHLDDQLLDILRAEGIRATLCGDPARRLASPAIVKRARAEGHTLRAAFGTPSRDVVDPFDWKRPGGEELRRRVLCAAAPGKSILLHVGVRDTIEALPTLIVMLRQRGLLGPSRSAKQELAAPS